VTNALDEFIDEIHTNYGSLKISAADMIEVNGYIVSMRVIADNSNQDGSGTYRTTQIGGSSSHVSISSAFSSS
jgi:hypothetical protein